MEGEAGAGRPRLRPGESGLRPHDRERRLPAAASDARPSPKRMETASSQFAGRGPRNSTACTGRKAGCGQHSRPFPCSEDEDQQDDDQNDQENGAKSDVHARSLLSVVRPIVPGALPRKTGKKSRVPRVLLTMTGKIVLRLGLLALFLVAFVGALTQLLAGRRPVLLGGAV